MIGKNVAWLEDEEEASGIIESVSLKDGIVLLITDNGNIETQPTDKNRINEGSGCLGKSISEQDSNAAHWRTCL